MIENLSLLFPLQNEWLWQSMSNQPMFTHSDGQKLILRVALRAGVLAVDGGTRSHDVRGSSGGGGSSTKASSHYRCVAGLGSVRRMILCRRSPQLNNLVMPRIRGELCRQALWVVRATLPALVDGCEMPAIVAVLGLFLQVG